MKWLKGLSRKEYRGASLLFLVMLLMFMTACGSTPTNTSSTQAPSNSSSTPAASTANPDDNKPIKVGALLTLSGPLASAGEGIKEGFDLYLENLSNKIGNHPVQIVYEDDENNPQTALRKLRKLVESDKIDILVGGVTSTVVYGILEQVEQYKLPMIVVNAGANEVSWKQKSDFIYRVSASNWQLGNAPAAYIANNIGKKIFIMSQDNPSGQEQVAAFKEAFNAAGGTVVQTAFPKGGTTDFATFMTQIAAAKPDVVYNTAPGADGVRFALQYSSFGLKGKIPLVSQVADEVFTTTEIIKALDGEYYFTPYSNQIDNKANKKFVESYKKKFNKEPSNYMDLGYDSAQMMVKSVEKAGSAKAGDLTNAMKDITLDTPRGNLVLDSGTHNPIEDFYMIKYVMKDNKMTYQMLGTLKDIKMPATNPKP